MEEIITLSHGSGGKMTHTLINELFHEALKNDILLQKGDAAVLPQIGGKLVFTTDSYVITPIFFPGGDIGKLAVCGTVNDLAVMGAKPLYLSCGFILEEGLLISELRKIVDSMAKACEEAGVQIVTGDTKVVPKGAVDKIFINTAGVGVIETDLELSPQNICPGDTVILTGTVGDHEATILVARENFNIHAELSSDCAPLNHMLQDVVLQFGNRIKVMRDATRGGVASTLNEFVNGTSNSIRLVEENIPLTPQVEGICEMLGIEPLYMANEGKVLMVVDSEIAETVVEKLQAHPCGKRTSIVGNVLDDGRGKVFIKTVTGGTRIVDMLTGEQLPRIC